MSDPRSSAAIHAALKGYAPTDEQWAAISHPLEPLYLIAGAGSGKTAVMAARIAWALENHDLSPSQVLGLTFTTKAAQELQDRVRLALDELHDESGEDVSVFTYNAFAAGVVRDHGLLANVEPEAGLLTDAQQWQLLLSCMDDLPPFDALEIRSSYVIGSALRLAGAVADHMVNLSDIDAAADRILGLKDVDDKIVDTAKKRKELVRAVDAYIKAKHRSGRIDFGDQITKAVEFLEGNDEVRDEYRTRYPFVLLDEYQDTNVAQRRMLQALVGEGGAVTAVGDARQAIFAWRGATMFNLINFATDFPRSNGQQYEEVSLSENFRSGSNILAVANAVVDKIDESRRPGKPLNAQPWNGTGRVQVGLFEDERAETCWIADQCLELHDSVLHDGREPVAWKDMAILVRRKAAMDMVLQALAEREIPVEVVGLGGLLKTPEVTEIVAWLRALETKPGSNRWLGRILLGPRWRIHYKDMSLLARWSASQNSDLRLRLAGGDPEVARDLEPGDIGFALAESLNHVDEIEHLSEEARRRLKSFARQLSEIRRKSNAPLLELVQEIIRTAGILDALESSSSVTAGAAKQNVSNFLDYVAAFAPVDGEATLRSFIAYLDAAESAEETLEASQPADQDSVKLMTVHAAKGLEFEVVFVPTVAARINKQGEPVYSYFPSTRTSNPLTSYAELPYEVREDAEHLPSFKGKLGDFQKAVKERVIEDERRLFYVALTRAKQRLSVTAAWWYGRDKFERGPSPFWSEVEALRGEGLVELVAMADPPSAPEGDEAKNPMFAAMEDRRQWPPPARVGENDPLFPDGWGAVADAVITGDVSIKQLLEEKGSSAEHPGTGVSAETSSGQSSAQHPGNGVSAETLIAEHTRDLDVIAAAMKAETPTEPQVPDIISATSYVALQNGDITAWDLIRPLPQRPTYARRLGTEVHRIIEERNRGNAPFADESELDEPGRHTEPSKLGEMLKRFEELGYADRPIAKLPSGELMVELPFVMKTDDGQIIRGRIDAVYETEDGGLEIIDWKTGGHTAVQLVDQISVYKTALTFLLQGRYEVVGGYARLASIFDNDNED